MIENIKKYYNEFLKNPCSVLTSEFGVESFYWVKKILRENIDNGQEELELKCSFIKECINILGVNIFDSCNIREDYSYWIIIISKNQNNQYDGLLPLLLQNKSPLYNDMFEFFLQIIISHGIYGQETIKCFYEFIKKNKDVGLDKFIVAYNESKRLNSMQNSEKKWKIKLDFEYNEVFETPYYLSIPLEENALYEENNEFLGCFDVTKTDNIFDNIYLKGNVILVENIIIKNNLFLFNPKYISTMDIISKEFLSKLDVWKKYINYSSYHGCEFFGLLPMIYLRNEHKLFNDTYDFYLKIIESYGGCFQDNVKTLYLFTKKYCPEKLDSFFKAIEKTKNNQVYYFLNNKKVIFEWNLRLDQ